MNKLIETAKEIDRILKDGIEILPDSPIHEKLKQSLNNVVGRSEQFPCECNTCKGLKAFQGVDGVFRPCEDCQQGNCLQRVAAKKSGGVLPTKLETMNRQLELFPTIHKASEHACTVSGSEFLSIVEAALQIAYEAGKWEGQVELEEHYDKSQLSEAIIESIYARKNAMPLKEASTGRTVTVNLRSDKWREGVRKSAMEYVYKAMAFVVAHYSER